VRCIADSFGHEDNFVGAKLNGEIVAFNTFGAVR
jgi:hypothetical protein